MKKLTLTILISAMTCLSGFAQEATDSTKSEKDTLKTEKDKGTRISLGKTKIIIMGSDDEANEVKSSSDSIVVKKKKQRSRHYAGIDLGVNGFINPDNSMNLQKEAEFLDVNLGNSFSLGINIFEKYIPIAKEKFGISTGLGFEFNSYDLKRDVVIYTDKDTTFGFYDSTRSIEKNRLKTTMINLPVMFETNIGKDADHSFHLAAGVMGSYRLGSKTKQIYSQNGKDFTTKNRTDFNMNPFRLNLVARIGYGNFTVYASYSITEMFEDNKGPEVHPFTIGLSLLSF